VVVVPQSFCTVCRRRIPKGSRCAKHRIVSPSSKAWHERGSARERQKVLDRDRGCRLCGRTEDLEVHHVIPAADGGPNTASNLVVLCGYCHHRVDRGDAAIPAGHICQTEPPQGLRTAQVCAPNVTQHERTPNWD
jgi:5-methylcytosine-specific restriction endonuclease McrA